MGRYFNSSPLETEMDITSEFKASLVSMRVQAKQGYTVKPCLGKQDKTKHKQCNVFTLFNLVSPRRLGSSHWPPKQPERGAHILHNMLGTSKAILSIVHRF